MGGGGGRLGASGRLVVGERALVIWLRLDAGKDDVGLADRD
jgi:hypothetical protein